MIQGMFDYGAMPTLERLIQFTSARHSVLADNVANISTPYYKSRDLDPESFQASLRKAIDRRRDTHPNPVAGSMDWQDTRQIRFGKDGMTTRSEAIGENILFHDENNRDLERTMQRVAENTLTHNTAIELLRSEMNLLRSAIRERLV